ncbi:hypothetical protein [Mycoplasma sp. ATU-Cv-703]|uniref:hypothetical protein n=1 Tax=Mycoplasma sp. ATU-Cv-703 TaxID=2498595 RepID=UPI000FDEC9AE
MHNKKKLSWIGQTLVVSWILTTLALSLSSIWDYSLIVGWIFGSLISGANAWMNSAYSRWLLENSSKGFALGLLRSWTLLLVMALVLIVAIAVNKFSNGLAWSESSWLSFTKPVNVFAGVGGYVLTNYTWVGFLCRKSQPEKITSATT